MTEMLDRDCSRSVREDPVGRTSTYSGTVVRDGIIEKTRNSNNLVNEQKCRYTVPSDILKV
jgi:hypothetical protein